MVEVKVVVVVVVEGFCACFSSFSLVGFHGFGLVGIWRLLGLNSSVKEEEKLFLGLRVLGV